MLLANITPYSPGFEDNLLGCTSSPSIADLQAVSTSYIKVLALGFMPCFGGVETG